MKPVVALLYANEPNPSLIERATALEASGRYEPYIVYWHRQASEISIPFSSSLPRERFIEISMPDPRGNPLRRSWLSLRYAWRLRSILRRLKPAVVYPVNPDMLGLARLALAGQRRVGIVYDFQDQLGADLGLLPRTIYRAIASRAVFVLIRSEGFRAQIDRHRLFRPGAPVRYFAEAPAGWQELMPRVDHAELVVGYFGNIRGRRQLETLMKAADKVRSTGRDVRLRFAGVGPDAAWVKTQSETLDYVEFLGPFDYFTTYRQLFGSADVIFAVYPLETPNHRTHEARRFHEAVAAGIPIIVSRGCYMSERVRDLGVGWDVDQNSAQELTDLLTRLHDDRELLRRAVATPEARIAHQFETYVPLLLEALDSAVKHRQR